MTVGGECLGSGITKEEKETGRRDTVSHVSGPLRVILTSWSLMGMTRTPPGWTQTWIIIINTQNVFPPLFPSQQLVSSGIETALIRCYLLNFAHSAAFP